jgi:hypothetical protein
MLITIFDSEIKRPLAAMKDDSFECEQTAVTTLGHSTTMAVYCKK